MVGERLRKRPLWASYDYKGNTYCIVPYTNHNQNVIMLPKKQKKQYSFFCKAM